uniref:UVR domain-containing protein n=1 Tax=Ostreococcus mediterraneus TaxID=1486918 RepID=A0A7S0PPZ0_9CHLO|mmetsp:Transcript_5867/g.21230  ORF Transcript_5867/g.21230 Transcript_5867/m.21230 type:complete len:728 (+) Transcript_5867:25-2208(+)
MFTRAGRALGADESPSSTSAASSVLTPNVTARSPSATPSTPSTPHGLYAKASSALREAMDGRNNDDGMRYAMINDARRTVQKLSEVLDGGFDAHGLGEDEKDAWLLQVECLREAVEDATANVAGELPSPVPSPVVREASADSSEMFEGLALAPSGTSTDTSDLDLFSGLNIVATPPTPSKTQVEVPQPISPHVLFEANDSEHSSSTPQQVQVRIGYGRDEMEHATEPTTAVPDFTEFGDTPEFTFAQVSRSASVGDLEDVPVFDETSSALVGEFEFALASSPLPTASMDGHSEDELRGLLQTAELRNKAPELAHRSCEVRIEACVKKRSVVGNSAMALVAQINELKSRQEKAVSEDDYEAAATLEDQISGVVNTYADTERKLLALETEFTSTIEESIKALENLVNAGKVSVEELTIFRRGKDELLQARNAQKNQAKQAANHAKEKLQDAKSSADEMIRQINVEIGEVKVRRGALAEPMSTLRAEIEDLRAQLEEKQGAYEAFTVQIQSLDAEEQSLISKAESTKTTAESAEAEIAKFLAVENVDDSEPVGYDEAESAMASIRDGLCTKEQILASTSNALEAMRAFIERESSAIAQEATARLELVTAENRIKTKSRSQKLIASLRLHITELEATKTTAASEKRFKDAADASTEIKRLTQQIEDAEKDIGDRGDDNDGIDTLRAALLDAQRATSRARIARLEEESRVYPTSTDAVRVAIDLTRIKHRDY